MISIIAIVIIIFSLKWYWLVEVNQPIETTKGVVQRAGTLEKLLDYDDSMDTHVRRGVWLKGIYFGQLSLLKRKLSMLQNSYGQL